MNRDSSSPRRFGHSTNTQPRLGPFTRNIILSAFAFVASLASLAWAGGDPWKTKPYQQWDQKDVQQVLRDSPWVKTQSVVAKWRKSPGPQITMGTEIIESDQPPAGVDVAPGLESGPMTSGQDAAEAEFLFRWNSSQTIRRALAQGAILNHKLNRPDAEKYAQPVRSDAEIVVLGQDMTPFAKISVDDLKAKTYLAAKQSKQKVNPSNVSVLRSPDGKRVTAVLFSFPRHLPAGQPLITPNDKNVEFACKLTGLDLHADFDLRKMLNEKGPDL